MDGKLAYQIIKKPYIWIGVLLFIVLSIFSVHKEKQVEKEGNKQVENMVRSIASDNIKIFKNIISNYSFQLEHVKFSIQSGLPLAQTLQYIQHEDSILQNIYETDLPYQLFEKRIEAQFSSDSCYLSLTTPLETYSTHTRVIKLDIPLLYFHQKVAENKDFTYAYLTLIQDERYIFHPDETKVGKELERDEIQSVKKLKEKAISESFSEYLGIQVYQYTEMARSDNSEWIFTANVPRISFKELIGNTRNAFISIMTLAYIAFILIFLFGILYWQREFLKRQALQKEKISLELKNEQQTKQALANELEHLKSGLNPHFLFNSLSSLSILVNKNAQQAQQFASALSNLYRYLLKHEKSELVSLAEELRFTKDYIYLQQIRFKDLIQVELSIPNNLLNRYIPPVSIQLLVENCIKHTKMSQKTPLRIKIYSDSDFIIVCNNYNPPERMHTSGKGLDNLTKRYALLTAASCSFSVEEDEFVAKIPLLAHAY